jgi:hypothetical protein
LVASCFQVERDGPSAPGRAGKEGHVAADISMRRARYRRAYHAGSDLARDIPRTGGGGLGCRRPWKHRFRLRVGRERPGAAARRSLESASVVSSITSWPIHASGIFPSNSDALGLSLSIIASSFDRTPPASVGYPCLRVLCSSPSEEHRPIVVMCDTKV